MRATTPGPRERLIVSAIELVRAHSVDAMGLSQLLEHSGTARRSIYQHFPGGKSELVATSTTAAGTWIQRSLRNLGANGDVAGAIRQLVSQIADNLSESNFALGCPVAAAASAAADSGIHQAAASAFDSWANELATALEREGRTYDEARSLAGFVVSAVEGALLRARCAKSTEPLEQAAKHLSTLLEGSSPSSVS